MSDEAQTPESGDMESTIRTAYDRLPDIQKNRKKTLWVILGYVAVILGIVGIGISAMVSTVEHNIVDRGDELASNLQQRLELILPKLEQVANEVAKDTLPGIQKQLLDALADAQRNLPAILDKSTRGMEARLTKKMNNKIDAAVKSAMESQREKLRSEMPDLFKCTDRDTKESCDKKDETLDLLMLELLKSYRSWAVSELRTTFSAHLTAMDDIRKTMVGFTPGKSRKGDSNETNMATAPDEMLTLWLELVGEAMAGSNDLFEEPGK